MEYPARGANEAGGDQRVRRSFPFPRPPKSNEPIWEYIDQLTRLRNVAAHKDYEEKKERLFTEFAEFFYPDPAFRVARGRDGLLEERTEFCTGYLMGMAEQFRRLRGGSSS